MASGSYVNNDSSYSTNSDGSINLGTLTVTALPQGYEWIEDLPSYGYTAFTYTNVGSTYDTLVLYANGTNSGWETAGMLGAGLVFGGAGAKAAKYGFSSFGEARTLYSQWGKGSFNTVKENIRHHSNKRGKGNYAKYMRQSSNFNKSGSKRTYLDDGAIRYNRPNGEFLIQRDNLTVTYGWN